MSEPTTLIGKAVSGWGKLADEFLYISGIRERPRPAPHPKPIIKEPERDTSWRIKETKEVTLIIGQMNDTGRRVDAYVPFSIKEINEFTDADPMWLSTHLSNYPMLYTTGGVQLVPETPRRYVVDTLSNEYAAMKTKTDYVASTLQSSDESSPSGVQKIE